MTNLNARKAGISPLQNNMNVSNLIQSVTGYQISTKNNSNPPSINTISNNINATTLNNNNNMNNSKNGPIRFKFK